MGPINANRTVVPAAFGKMVPPVGLQTNVEQNWILARDILVREAPFTSSQQAHFLLFMRMSALGPECVKTLTARLLTENRLHQKPVELR